jgi:hypothetical protein
MIEEIRLLSLSRSFEQRYKMTTRLLLQLVCLFLTVTAQAAGGDSFAEKNGNEQVIATTDEHPFWVVSESGSRYVDAKDLQVGNIFIGANGELTTLTVTNRVGYPDGITVYNFTVADNHNYFVVASLEVYENGASVVLVHNGDCGVNNTVSWAPKSDITILSQLKGSGQIAGFRRNPHLKGYSADALLAKTPFELEQMVANGELPSKILKQIKKLFEGRDLRHGN